MSSGQTVKTTVRIPEELHWQFQAERAKRRLTNARAIGEALSFWIASPAGESPGELSFLDRSVTARELRYIDAMMRILRDPEHPAAAAALAALLEALLDTRRNVSGQNGKPPLARSSGAS